MSTEKDNETAEMKTDGGTLVLEIPLDPIHQSQVAELKEADVNVEQSVLNQTLPSIEESIYRLYQEVKYGGE
jgi:hypothetical protein